jgi:hypothetical protein
MAITTSNSMSVKPDASRDLNRRAIIVGCGLTQRGVLPSSILEPWHYAAVKPDDQAKVQARMGVIFDGWVRSAAVFSACAATSTNGAGQGNFDG